MGLPDQGVDFVELGMPFSLTQWPTAHLFRRRH